MKITLATLPQATEQQVFDQVALHLLTQDEKSWGPLKSGNDGCMYRGPRGLTCAAGCLIGDDEYQPGWENSVYTDIREAPAAHKSLIYRLQSIHDTYEIVEWPKKLTNLAKECSLSSEVVINFRAQS